MDKKILIYTSNSPTSIRTKETMLKALQNTEYEPTNTLEDGVELIVVVGGDGTFLDAIHKFEFPDIPFVGINTGHLGFFQELVPEDIETFMNLYKNGKYTVQSMQTVYASVVSDNQTDVYEGLNEIIIASASDYAYSVHFNIYIGGSYIEHFSGDGLLISTPAGSTAYNYSLGGSIVDPRLRLLQATPIAPMNTIAFRSFTSSILLPPDKGLGIVPSDDFAHSPVVIAYDGFSKRYDSIDKVDIKMSDTHVDLIRLESYDFWDKVKSKFLL